MIFEETEYRFQLAMDALISSTDLLSKLGNLADTEIAQQIIEGTFDIPEEIDEATAKILEEIGSMGIKMIGVDHDLARGVPTILEKSKRRHLLVPLRCPLWTLQGRVSLRGAERLLGEVDNTYSSNRMPTQTMEPRPHGHVRKDRWACTCQ